MLLHSSELREGKSLPQSHQCTVPQLCSALQGMLRLAWLTDADVLVSIIDQPLVDLIRDAQDIMLLTQTSYQLQLHLREYLWETRSQVCCWDCPQGQRLLRVQDHTRSQGLSGPSLCNTGMQYWSVLHLALQF